MRGTTVKSCGKRHAQCRQCSPQWAAKIAFAAKGRRTHTAILGPTKEAIRRSVPVAPGRQQHSAQTHDAIAEYEGGSPE